MKPALARSLLVVFALALSILTIECGLRLIHFGSLAPLSGEHVLRTPHPTRGWALEPGGSAYQRSLDYAVTVDINDHGLRDRPHAYRTVAGVARIVVLGDSFMEAYQVPLEASLPYRLQEILAEDRVEVINLGVGGYGTAQQLRALQSEGLRYSPQIVILAFYTGNDIQNNSRALQEAQFGPEQAKTYGRPYAHAASLTSPIAWSEPDHERMLANAQAARQRRASWPHRLAKLAEPTLLAHLMTRATARAAAYLGEPPADPKTHFGWPFLEHFESPAWREAWLVTRRLILEIRDVSQAAGAEFALLIVPAKLQVEPEFRELAKNQHVGVVFDEQRINRAIASFCLENGIALYDPTAAFVARTAAGEVLYHQLEDHHWNIAGHDVAARGLARFLEQSELIR